MKKIEILADENSEFFMYDFYFLFGDFSKIIINYSAKKPIEPYQAKEKIRNHVKKNFYDMIPKSLKNTLEINSLIWGFNSNLNKAEIKFV